MPVAPLRPEELFPGERIVLSKNANAVIDVSEGGLSRFAFDDFLWLVGMKGKEAIGGRVHLTNYRLVFRAHRFNRLRGSFSVFLPSVADVRDTSFAVTRKVTVTTALQSATFVAWGVPRFIETVLACRAALGPAHQAQLARLVLAEPWKAGEGLRVAERLEQINRVLAAVRAREGDIQDAASALAGVLDGTYRRTDVAGVLGIVELLQHVHRSGRAHLP
ncbi:hypothetical protein [Streptomyces griseosporeus]|uniref:hypothetical protein n=1 Tax=Streptomyces griseosporeus TaxID=1910 RepID=UPI0036C07EC3